MLVFSREINKSSTREGGAEMAEWMHIVLFNNSKNNKMQARVGKTTTFVVKLDFLNFVPLMKIDDSFCQKSLLLARCVEFVTFAFKKAPVMEIIG